MSAFKFSKVHKSQIRKGDIIKHNGKEVTVCASDISRCDFLVLKYLVIAISLVISLF